MIDQSVELVSVFPIVAVRDLEIDLAYYVECLGFAVSWRWGEPPVRAGVTRNGLEVQLVSDGRFAPDGTSTVYFDVKHVDAYYAECVENGAEVTMPLGDRPFGVRDFRVVDPSGNVLGFGEPLVSWAEEGDDGGGSPAA